jgi:outer membrane lipoprotein carrier protein
MSALPALLLSLAAVQPAEAPTDAEEWLRRLERRTRAVRDVSARFTQVYRSGMLGRRVEERGTLRLKRPGRMLWEYEHPERKTFVSDGTTIFFYVPEDRQVIVRDQAGEKGLAMELLAGEPRLEEDFLAAIEDGGGALTRLRLTPRSPRPELQSLALELDAQARIRSIEIVDVQGNLSRFRFDEIRENVGLPDRLFRFEPPKGVQVVAG